MRRRFDTPAEGRARLPSVVVVGAALLVVPWAGCADEHVLELRRWTLVDATGASSEVSLPGSFDARLAPHAGSYRLRTDVSTSSLPKGGPLTVSFPVLPATAALRANGRDLTPLTESSLQRYRAWNVQSWRVPADVARADVLHLELTADYRWQQAAWIEVAPRISATPLGDARSRLVWTFNALTHVAAGVIALVCLLSSGLMFLRLRGPRRAPYGWVFGGTLLALGVPLFALEVTQALGPAELALVFTCLAVSGSGGVVFVRAYLGKPFLRSFLVLPASHVLVGTAITPFGSLKYVAVVTIALGIAHYVLLGWTLVQAYRQPQGVPSGLWMLAVGIFGGVALAVPDLLWPIGVGMAPAGVHTFGVGFAVLCVAQIAALGAEHRSALARADALVVELTARLTEVGGLNEDLRRQIAARSEGLADILSRLQPTGAAAELVAGQVVEGRYRVERVLGTGGMGAVYEAERLRDGTRVAIKVMQDVADPSLRARFAREAQLAAEIDHPHVVRILDVDVATGGVMFLVMELLEGRTLRAAFERFGDVAWALPILTDITAGLEAIHASGIVHRDLKPTNVMLCPAEGGAERAVLMDLGIARRTDAPVETPDAGDTTVAARPPVGPSPPDLTRTRALVGTPAYMAAELAAGSREATPASDVFALGVIAAEMLTGLRPFTGNVVDMARAGQELPSARPLATACPGLPLELAALLDRALSHDPAVRPSASELGAALRSHAGARVAAPPPDGHRSRSSG